MIWSLNTIELFTAMAEAIGDECKAGHVYG